MPEDVGSTWNFTNCLVGSVEACVFVAGTILPAGSAIIAKRVTTGIPLSPSHIGKLVKVRCTKGEYSNNLKDLQQ